MFVRVVLKREPLSVCVSHHEEILSRAALVSSYAR
jgi:hypothetical protein